jgi:hypothetical protein
MQGHRLVSIEQLTKPEVPVSLKGMEPPTALAMVETLVYEIGQHLKLEVMYRLMLRELPVLVSSPSKLRQTESSLIG